MPRGKILHRRSHSEFSSGLGEDLFKEVTGFDKLDAVGDSPEHNSGSSENEGESVRPRHYRNGSFDSLIMGKKNSSSFNLNLSAAGEFSSAELEKIMANEMLAKIALADPKRVKRFCSFFLIFEIRN